MEVHVRNVPEQGTENGLRKSLQPYFANLSIRAVHCQKQRGKRYASFTFLHITDGQRFLAHHGQTRQPPGSRRPRQNSSTVINLMFLNQPIYCEKSDREANPYLLRVLRKEENDRQNKAAELASSVVPHDKGPDMLPISFDFCTVSCGVWR